MTVRSRADQETELQALVEREMERWKVPGVSIALRDGDTVSTHTFGVTSVETEQPVTPGTVFQIGSITKVYTATLLMMLVDEGAIDLDTPVVGYVPDLQLADAEALSTITMRHLLTHTAGIYGDLFADTGLGDDALARSIATFGSLRQLTRPGELWTYCNSGFYLAGHVIATLSGRPYETVMRERLIEPLGMERSFMFAHEAITYPLAVGHQSTDTGATVARDYTLARNVAAAGAVISTAEDVMKFAALHLENGMVGETRLLSEAATREMRTPQVPAAVFCDYWGLGWMVRRVGDTDVVEHGGTTNGQQAWLTVVPGQDFAVTVLTNSSQGAPLYRQVVAWALQRYRGLVADEPQPVALEDEELTRFAGLYENPNSHLTVKPTESGLRLSMVPAGAEAPADAPPTVFTMQPIGDTVFLIVDGAYKGLMTDFISHPDGSIRFIRLGGRLSDRVDRPTEPPAG